MKTKQEVSLGQFFTKKDVWLKPQIKAFIHHFQPEWIYDPFAGKGDILKAMESIGFNQHIGCDIDESHQWQKQDSLVYIKPIPKAMIVTNPPYLSNYSASRKKVIHQMVQYFISNNHHDLYFIALDRMLETNLPIVAIIPETFILSDYPHKNRLHSITILEDNPFEDTDVPVCVACFNPTESSDDAILVYKNEQFLFDYQTLLHMRLKSNRTIPMRFNDPSGWLALRAVDSTNPSKPIAFSFKEDMDYDWDHGIKVSSRLYTLIQVEVPEELRFSLIQKANQILHQLRKESFDVILSPFKGNMKTGVRRRRLDYQTARAILERSVKEIQLRAKEG